MKTTLTLLVNVTAIAVLLALVSNVGFNVWFELGLYAVAFFLVVNWLFGWVGVLRAEWAARRKPELSDPSEPIESEPDPFSSPRLAKRVKDAKRRLGQAGIRETDLRRQQDRLRRFMGED